MRDRSPYPLFSNPPFSASDQWRRLMPQPDVVFNKGIAGVKLSSRTSTHARTRVAAHMWANLGCLPLSLCLSLFLSLSLPRAAL